MGEKILYSNEIFTLELMEIQIQKTYRNLLCGLPTKEINEGILSDEIENTGIFSELEDIFCIEPIETEIPLEIEYELGKSYKLPHFVYKAVLSCYSSGGDLLSFLNDSDHYYFQFGLVWFDDDISIEIRQDIMEYAIEKSKPAK